MSVDLACADPAFLDLTFDGLEAIPLPGEERLARDFLRSPGGGAITAVGAARLGLTSAVVSPLGDDPPGMLVREMLADDGVLWAGRRVKRSPVTVIMPSDGDRAMATFDPGESATAGEIAAVDPRSVVLSLPRLALAPAAARVYATVGDVDARALSGGALPDLSFVRAVLVNEREAHLLTGSPDPETAAALLAEHAPLAIVTLGESGALAAGSEGIVRVYGVCLSPSCPPPPPRAPATCSAPPTSGPTTGARRWRSACAGRCSTRPCRCGSRRRSRGPYP
jgi:ribokinase